MADQTTYDARVTAIRVANPTLSLVEAQKLARGHAREEGFYAPGIGTSGLESLPVNDDNEPTMAERLIADLESDPRAQDALRWSNLTPEQKADETAAVKLLAGLKVHHADLVDRAKAAGTYASPMEVLLTNNEAPQGVRRAARAMWEREAMERADKANEPSVSQLRAAVDSGQGE